MATLLCAKHIAPWQGRALDENNLIGRACILNQEKTRLAVVEAEKKQVDVQGLPWDVLIGGFRTATDSYLAGKPNVLFKFIQTMLGPLSEVFLKHMGATNPLRPCLIALCVGSGTPMVTIKSVGTLDDFMVKLTDFLYYPHEGDIRWGTIKELAEKRKRLLGIKGVRVKGGNPYEYAAVVDQDTLKRMPAGLTPAQQEHWLVQQIITPETAEARMAVRSQIGSAKLGVCGGSLSALLQGLALFAQAQALGGSMAHEKKELAYRMGMSTVVVASTITEVIGNMAILQAGEQLGSQLAKSGRRFVALGTIAGGVAGIALAAADFYQGWRQQSKHNYGLASLHFIQFGLGAAVSIFALLSGWFPWMGPWGFGLALVSIIIGLVIDDSKDNKIQMWLDHCCWGKLQQERYQSMYLELKELNLVMGK